MQKVLAILLCFFFPVLSFIDFSPFVNLLLVALLFKIKVIIGFILVAFAAAFNCIKTFFNLFLHGFNWTRIFELLISFILFFGSLFIVRNIVKNLYSKSLQILCGELKIVPNLHKMKNDVLQIRKSVISIFGFVQKLPAQQQKI